MYFQRASLCNTKIEVKKCQVTVSEDIDKSGGIKKNE